MAPESLQRPLGEIAAPIVSKNDVSERPVATSAPSLKRTPTVPMSQTPTAQQAGKGEVGAGEAPEASSPQHLSSRAGIEPRARRDQPRQSDLAPTVGALLQTSDQQGRLLIAAIPRGEYKTVTVLLDEVADVNVADADSMTALMHAVENGNEPLVGLLPERGADVGSMDKSGTTALDLALDTGSPKLIRFIVSRDPQKGSAVLVRAVKKGSTDPVELLLNAGADINSPDALGNTPLMLAAEMGNADMVELLLEKGQTPRQRTRTVSLLWLMLTLWSCRNRFPCLFDEE